MNYLITCKIIKKIIKLNKIWIVIIVKDLVEIVIFLKLKKINKNWYKNSAPNKY